MWEGSSLRKRWSFLTPAGRRHRLRGGRSGSRKGGAASAPVAAAAAAAAAAVAAMYKDGGSGKQVLSELPFAHLSAFAVTLDA